MEQIWEDVNLLRTSALLEVPVGRKEQNKQYKQYFQKIKLAKFVQRCGEKSLNGLYFNKKTL